MNRDKSCCNRANRDISVQYGACHDKCRYRARYRHVSFDKGTNHDISSARRQITIYHDISGETDNLDICTIRMSKNGLRIVPLTISNSRRRASGNGLDR
jgi:hypothetical protein